MPSVVGPATKLYWTRELYRREACSSRRSGRCRSMDDIEAFAAKDIDYALFSGWNAI